MSEGSLHSLPEMYPQGIEAVETALNMPLFPPDFNMSEALANETEDRSEIHVKAYELALNAIAHLTGRPANQNTPLSEEEARRIAENDDIRFLKSLLAVANNVYEAERQEAPRPPGADAASAPRATEQAAITRQISSHLQTLPRELSYSGTIPLREQFDDTMVGIAPAGSGKTVVEATLLRYAGIGKPGPDGRTLRAAIATTELGLVDELIGKRGDGTFQRFLGDVNVTPYHGSIKKKDGPVVASTGRSLTRLDPKEFDMVVVDEGHQVLGPQLLEYIKKIGVRCLLFTATPTYDRQNDLRHHFRYVERGTLLDYIAKRILNPTRISSFTYEKNPLHMAASIACHYIRAGRKVVVYCPKGTKENPGGPSKKVARLINEMLGEDLASHIGKHRSRRDNQRLLKAFDLGEVQAMCTSRMLREGANIKELSVGILVGPNTSLLDLAQKAGRPMRPGEYISELIELLPRNRQKNAIVSLWQLVGLDYVKSGQIFRPVDGEVILEESDTQAQRPKVVDLTTLPLDIQAAMVVDKPVRLVTIGENVSPPEGYIQSSVAAAERGLPRRFLHYMLDKEGYRYEGIWAPSEDGWEHDRWYEPSASDYLETLPSKIGELELHAAEAAEMCGVSRTLFVKIANDMDITLKPRLGRKNHRSKVCTYEQLLIISEAIEAVPVAEETDVPLIDLQRELNSAAAPNSLGVLMRRNPVHGIRGWCQHVSTEEAARLRRDYYGVPVADKNHRSVPVLAEMAGVTLSGFRQKMTAKEKAATIPLRRYEGARPTDHLSLEAARPIMERFAPEKVPPHLVTLEFIEQIIPRGRTTIIKNLQQQNPSPRKLYLHRPRKGPAVNVFTWRNLQALENKYGRRPDVAPIPYDGLAHDETEAKNDPAKWQLSREVQKRYTPEELLTPLPGADARETAAAGVAAEAEPAPSAPANHAKAKEATTPAESLSPAQLGVKPAVVLPPAYTVDLNKFLTRAGTLCSPTMAKLLARRANLPVPRQDSTGVWWATKTAAEGVKKAIESFPKAERGMKSPADIAKTHAQYGINARHVMHLASLLTKSLEAYVQNRRIRMPDGGPGELCLHYNKLLTTRLENELNAVVKDSRRLNMLLRFPKFWVAVA